VGKPLWWALEQMGVVGEEGLLGSFTSGGGHGAGAGGGGRSGREAQSSYPWAGDYVLVGLVERAADEVQEWQRGKMGGRADALYTFEEFRETFGGVVGSTNLGEENEPLRETDAKVLIKFLERDRGAVVVDKEVC